MVRKQTHVQNTPISKPKLKLFIMFFLNNSRAHVVIPSPSLTKHKEIILFSLFQSWDYGGP